ncbi:MAG: phosphotransferase [Wenzhouxiangella sp.]|jgi:aminoglycoside/choline kinase family phosphotransferase|nr:phosphotransferase [Wenzhouxiangella sp.]
MDDHRRKEAEHWAATKLNWNDWNASSISSDASFRRYFRLASCGRSFVVMDAPPARESIDAFIDIARRLSTLVHVPDILAYDSDSGFVLLEDLGDQPFHQALNPDNADELFDDAIAALIRIQSSASTVDLPEYDAAMLLGELDLFTDWFVARHWQVEPTDAELDTWDRVCALLIRWALDQPKVFCHRDFMPRNLLLSDPNPGIIDFQDAVLGPVSYDPVCLFRDAFLSWPNDRVDAWLESYRQRALAAGIPLTESAALWRRTCDFTGVQRHLKVIGIFARIRYRDGKPRYLEDAPRFFAYLASAIERNRELAGLETLLNAWRERANRALP